jgi:predicted RecA/RadA family phage recombinase
MKNFVQDGDVLTVTAPAAVVSGQFILIGTALYGFCTTDAANGAQVEILTEGVFDVPKVSAQAWAVGDKIYWDNTAKLFTTVLTSNTYVGVAVAVAANPTSTGRIRLNEFV